MKIDCILKLFIKAKMWQAVMKKLLILSVFLFGILTYCSGEKSPAGSTEDFFTELEDSSGARASIINDSIYRSRQNAITRAVSRVSPAVVGINVTQIRRFREPSLFENDPFWYWYYRPREYMQKVKGLGSGFIISPNGYILTNEHVVERAEEIVVTMTDGKHYQATRVGEDHENDIALLKIDVSDLPFIPLGDSDDVIIGEWAIALGNPFGLFDVNSKPTVTVGVISSVGMNFGGGSAQRSYQNMIQTDAAINSGNSGGPLVNSEGKCIGINAFIISGSERQGTSIGLGFAIPINRVKQLLPDLKNQLARAREGFETGLEVENINWLVASMLGISPGDGVIVSGVESRSPAARAGIQVGDVIVSMDGIRVRSSADVLEIIDKKDPSQSSSLILAVFRNGKLYKVTLKI